jgi:hypothetical protein
VENKACPEEYEEERVKLFITELRKTMTQYDCQNILEIGCGRASLRELPGYTGLDFSLEALTSSGLDGFIFADITKHILFLTGSSMQCLHPPF